MTVEDLLPRLEAVRRTSRGFQARCPAHPDKTPSLSVSEGERGILLKCWSGCTLREICESLGVEQRELFWGALDLDPLRRRKAAQQRDRQRHIRERIAHQHGTLIDALKAAGIEVEKREVTLPEGPLRTLGEHEVTIELDSDVTAVVKLNIVMQA